MIKRLHFPLEVMLVCVQWYAAYPLSLRNLEEWAPLGVLSVPRTGGRVAKRLDTG
jgi:transposase-like protein